MKKSLVAKALARALVFAAWADGRITKEERQYLDQSFSKLPSLEKEALKECHSMLEHKPLQSEALTAFKQLRNATTLAEDKAFAIESIRGLMLADGEVCPLEVDFIQAVDRVINGNEELYYAEMSRMIKQLSF